MVASLPPYMERWGAHREEDRGKMKMSEPLQMTFVADPPLGEFDVLLINILIRQANNDAQSKADVLRACKFVVAKLEDS